MRLKLFAALTVLATSASVAQPQPATPPKLLVVISVDQFSADLFDEYRSHFTDGLARLASGMVFRNGYQSHAATETCPGHSSILTGDHPSRTGIVANFWIDQKVGRSDVTVYCAEDEKAPSTSSTAYKVSPVHLLVPTLGELAKARWPGSRNVAVSGKDRAAVMMTGRNVDQRWYWTGQKFETDLAGAAVPQTVVKANAAMAAALANPREPFQPTPFCQAKAREVPVQKSDKSVGSGRFARNAEDQNAFRASPELDAGTLALAAGLVDEMQLGRRAAPDVLGISLSATDYVGHTYGTEGEEMCLQLLELDRDIGGFLSVLDSRRIDYAVALTADHGGQDIPERKRLAGVANAARVDPALSAGTIGLKLVKQLGLRGFGLLGESSFGDIYMDHGLPAKDQKRLLAAAVAAYRAHPQVEAVFTASEIAATPMPTTSPDRWTLIQRARASYYPGRSGDFLVVLKRDITPISDTSRYIATHGSPWDYDRRVPILFWRAGAAGKTIDAPADTVDIMPTLAALLGLDVAAGSVDGKCLNSVASCGPAAASSMRGSR
jgi:predicted AlkP superfamily pyrophosphatase or phosphodiesterase